MDSPKRPSNAGGYAPEALQQKIKLEKEARLAEQQKELAEASEKSPLKKMWHLAMPNNESREVPGTEVQVICSGGEDPLLFPSDRSASWGKASTFGFIVGVVEGTVVKSSEPLGTTHNEFEEALEQLPDNELLLLAIEKGLLKSGDPFDRTHVVKCLADAKVLP